MTTDEELGGPQRLTAASYWMLSILFLVAALIAANLPMEFNDTRTSVVDGLHRYLTKPYAGSVRWAFAAVGALLVASAACSVLAAAARGGRTARSLYQRGGVSCIAVLALLITLWFVAAPAFPSANTPHQPGPPIAATRPPPLGLIPAPPTTVPQPKTG